MIFILAVTIVTLLLFTFIIWRNGERKEETMDRFWRTVWGAVAGGCLVGLVLDFPDPSEMLLPYIVIGSCVLYASMRKPEPPKDDDSNEFKRRIRPRKE